MAFSTLVSFSAGLGFLSTSKPAIRRLYLIIPIAVDLLLLGFFKYANFALESTSQVADWLGVPLQLPVLNIILPIGISFYTFHTITYIVDCYRGTITPTKNIFEFLAYVSLFSQLVAGPIVRFREIESDLESLGRADQTRWLAKGLVFFLFGMLEKVLVADSLAAWVDPSWVKSQELSSTATWLMVVAYTFQLYFDFCGYSSMAIGLGFMFGIQIPKNFDSPYKALDPSDFWRRWHISLSTCLRDYLYIPLGGSRGSAWVTNRNLLLTMLLGGLWHGANWTFVLWGLYHGLLLVGHRQLSAYWKMFPSLLRQLLMFILVVVGWVLFRSANLAEAGGILYRMFTLCPGEALPSSMPLICTLTAVAYVAMFGPNVFDLFHNYKWRKWHGFALATAFGICTAIITGGGNSPFLYFQF